MRDVFSREILLFLVLLWGTLVLFLNLGKAPLSEKEGILAEVSREMLISSDYFHPTLNGKEFSRIVLLPSWLAIGISKLLGEFNETTLRLSSAFAGMIVLLLVYSFTKEIFGKQSGVFALILTLTTYGFLMLSRTFNADIFLMFLLFIANYILLKFLPESPFFRSFFIFLISVFFVYFGTYPLIRFNNEDTSFYTFLILYLAPWNFILILAIVHGLKNWSKLDNEYRSLLILISVFSLIGLWYQTFLNCVLPFFLILIAVFLDNNFQKNYVYYFLISYNFLLAFIGILSFALALLPHNLLFYPHERPFRFVLGILGILLLSFSLFYNERPFVNFYKIVISCSLIWFAFFSFLKPIISHSNEKILANIVAEMQDEKFLDKIYFFRDISPTFLYYLDPPHPLTVIKEVQEIVSCRKRCLLLVHVRHLPEVLPFAKRAEIVTLPKTLVKNPKYLGLFFP